MHLGNIETIVFPEWATSDLKGKYCFAIIINFISFFVCENPTLCNLN